MLFFFQLFVYVYIQNYEDDGHDWYCWVCHREGEVYLCSRCPRVIHKKCAELTSEDLTDDFVCYCCKVCWLNLFKKKVELSHRFYLKINLTLKSNFIKITLRYGCSPVSTSLKSGD